MRNNNFVVNVVLFVVCFFDYVIGLGRLGGRRFRILGQTLPPLGPYLMPDLDDNVAEESHKQNAAHHVQFHFLAQVSAVGVGDHESGRFPESEIAERRLFIPSEQCAVNTLNTKRTMAR